MAENGTLISKRPSFVRTVGSLWFAGVLLVLLMVAMAAATAFESKHGTDQALRAFYLSWWFTLLLSLVGVNVLAALVVRYPFSRKQIGFVVAHTGILVILAGALVTRHWAVNGQVGFEEGETVKQFTYSELEALTVVDLADRNHPASIDLNKRVFGGYKIVDNPQNSILNRIVGNSQSSVLKLKAVQVDILRYLPDVEERSEVVNDNPRIQPAVEISLSELGKSQRRWIFANDPRTMTFSFRVVDATELKKLLAPPPTTKPASKSMVKIEYQGEAFAIPMKDALAAPVPLGQTGLTIRVLRYLPDAKVTLGGKEGKSKLWSASDQPNNPAIEVELAGPEASERRFAFALHPNLDMHQKTEVFKELKLVFVTANAQPGPSTPVEVLGGPQGQVYARFRGHGGTVVTKKLTLNVPVQTPWPQLKFAVVRRFDRARKVRSTIPVDPIRKNRKAAMLVALDDGEHRHELWLTKDQPQRQSIHGRTYELLYGNKRSPLGFDISLDRFNIGYYPGGTRPRSFQSQVTIVDPDTGASHGRLISMNKPTSFGGYNFYQSSYRLDGKRRISFLSVSRDPGKPVAFAGYIALMAGMLITLATKLGGRKKNKPQSAQSAQR